MAKEGAKVKMGRRPGAREKPLRADWVYVGRGEAEALSGATRGMIERLIAAGELAPAMRIPGPAGGRLRHLYRLDAVLAAVKGTRR